MNQHYHQEKKYQQSVAGKRKPTPKAIVSHDEADDRKKDKKLVFLSKSVLKKVRERPMVTGT